MSVLDVVSAGPMITVQDLGRAELQRFGFSEGGALDRDALRLGAALVGNDVSVACLELIGLGGRFICERDTLICITGADMPLLVDGHSVPHETSAFVQRGARVDVGAPSSGHVAYLHVDGGIDTDPAFGSRSTDLRSCFGGHEGRRLADGDKLPLGAATNRSPMHVGVTSRVAGLRNASAPIRVMWNPQATLFDQRTRDRFLGAEFAVGHQRTRMSLPLESELTGQLNAEASSLISAPGVLGDIQIPGVGTPIVLLHDRQPTAGYPRIATVISADLARVVQSPPGTPIRFEIVDGDTARREAAQHRSIEETRLDSLVRAPASSNPAMLHRGQTSGDGWGF